MRFRRGLACGPRPGPTTPLYRLMKRIRSVAYPMRSSWHLANLGHRIGEGARFFNKTSHNFGTVAHGTVVEYRFTIQNIYVEDVHIQSVRVELRLHHGEADQAGL